jgi:type IX secretion system PorP/SprF family membrane protein
MKTKIKTFVLGIFIPTIILAQDVHFSQIAATPLLLNASQAGLGHDALAIVNYKNQWQSVSASPYRTVNVSADFGVLKKKSGTRLGLGLDVFSDKAGDGNMGTTAGALHLAGILGVNDNNLLSAGISSGFGQRVLNINNLSWGNQYDGVQYSSALPSGEPASFNNYSYFDLGAGISWFYSAGHSTLSSNDARRVNIGLAVQHLNKPVYSFYGNGDERLPVKFVAHGNAAIGIKNYSLILEPSYLVMIQGGHREITPGLFVKYVNQESSKYTGRKKTSAFGLGGYYRFKDAFVAEARYEFSNWSIGTSYDFNISDLTAASKSKGGFEISLRFISPDPFGKRVSNTSSFN